MKLRPQSTLGISKRQAVEEAKPDPHNSDDMLPDRDRGLFAKPGIDVRTLPQPHLSFLSLHLELANKQLSVALRSTGRGSLRSSVE